MKKTKTETENKKLSIETVTVRRLETELTPEQLKLAQGAHGSEACGSTRAVC